jgi:hypothetical protein
VGGLPFNKSNMDGSDEFASGDVEKQIAMTVISMPDEHAPKCLWE